MNDEASRYYARGREAGRLPGSSHGQLEQTRTQELLLRHLPPAPATILDVGGGAGIYSFWLADLGYQVHLSDLAPMHVEQARANPAAGKLASIEVGDARTLPNVSADAVLLLGPLYHLTERPDRIQAIREAYRVLRPGGLLAASAISRYASVLDGLFQGYFHDPAFAAIVEQDLRDGQHRNPDARPGWFTTAYFHRPVDLKADATAAGFAINTITAIEGPAAWLQNLDDWWADPAKRERALTAIRAIETNPDLLGASPHLLLVARKP